MLHHKWPWLHRLHRRASCGLLGERRDAPLGAAAQTRPLPRGRLLPHPRLGANDDTSHKELVPHRLSHRRRLRVVRVLEQLRLLSAPPRLHLGSSRLPLGCLSAPSRLPLGCLSAASRLPLGCLSAASRLPLGCLSAASRLPLGCLSAASRLPLGYLSAASRLPLGYLSATSRLPLGCLSAASRLPLGYLSAASRLPLGHLSGELTRTWSRCRRSTSRRTSLIN